MKSQVSLAAATKEATTGRYADVGLGLGALTGRDVGLRAEMSRIEKITDTNELVKGRLDASQAALTSVSDTAQTFLKNLIAARDTADGGQVLMPVASTNLVDLVSKLNTTLDGQYLFGGINTGVQTLNEYTATSAAKTSVDAAFLAEFGCTQSNPAVNNISGSAMATFLDVNFANLFDDPTWAANWSSASDTTIHSRISTTSVIETSASANESGIRKLAMVYTMMSDLGAQSMNETAYHALVDKAISLTTSAIGDLTATQGRLGTAQQSITGASATMKIQKDLLTEQVNALEAVNPTEASVRVKSLQTQVEMALSLISRIQQMSILNYM
jgi:flagellar hook-associated protein 3 FlgL